jgi:hypothetical protein
MSHTAMWVDPCSIAVHHTAYNTAYNTAYHNIKEIDSPKRMENAHAGLLHTYICNILDSTVRGWERTWKYFFLSQRP